MAIDHTRQPIIKLGRANARIPQPVLPHDGGHELVDAVAGFRRQHKHRHPAQFRQRAQQCVVDGLAHLLAVEFQIPFIDADNERTAFAFNQIRQLDILLVKRATRVNQQHHNLGKFYCAKPVGNRQLFQLFRHAGLAPHASGIPQGNSAPRIRRTSTVPNPVDGNAVARDASLRPRQQTVCAKQPVN